MANDNDEKNLQEGEEERRQQNEEAGRTQDQQQQAAREAEENAPSVAEGDRVTVLTDTPEGRPVKGTVRVVQDEAGKRVGVELDEYTAYAHGLDGLVDEREQGDGQPVIGKGWWTTEQNIQKLDEGNVS